MSELGPQDVMGGEELRLALATFPEWALTEDGQKLARTFMFADFEQAFAFMTQVALEAEALNHHPEWSNAWNRVTIELMTHTAGGVTMRDIELAGSINRAASGYELLCMTDGDESCGGCR